MGTEIKDMDDGQLSEAVAVEVMGWAEYQKASLDLRGHTWSVLVPPEGCKHDTPPYATDIAAAMEVFEKVRQMGAHCYIWASPKLQHIEGHRPFRAMVATDDDISLRHQKGDVFIEDPNRLPRGICEAALLWARSRTDG